MEQIQYTVRIVDYPTHIDGHEDGVIEVLRDSDGVDRALRFLCHNSCKCKIYIPLGNDNNEGGSGVRELHWIERDKVLSITPSILIKGGCHAHYYITNNKVQHV